MKVAVFGTKQYDREFLTAANDAAGNPHQLDFFEPRLDRATARLAQGYGGVCVFVNDQLDATTLRALAAGGTGLIALRCSGFNNVDVHAAQQLGMTVARVPAYSPHAVAEHTVGLMLSLNRKLHRAYARVREGNFSLEGLLGFDMHGRTAGIVGAGEIGTAVARILRGFGCRILASDIRRSSACEELGVEYAETEELFRESHILTLHCPLTPQTHHLIDADALAQMKDGVMLINTSRGALVDTQAVLKSLKSGGIGSLGLDVYEEEADLFFENLSDRVIQDDVFARLLTFPNVLITGHQAFFTRNALETIARVTLENVSAVEHGEPCTNAVTIERS